MFEYRYDIARPDGSFISGRFVGDRVLTDAELAQAIADEITSVTEDGEALAHPQATATPGEAVLVQLVRDMLPFVEEWRQGDEHNPEGRREWWESVLKRAEMALAQGGKAQ